MKADVLVTNSTRHHSHLPTRLQHRCWQLLLLAQLLSHCCVYLQQLYTKKLLRSWGHGTPLLIFDMRRAHPVVFPNDCLNLVSILLTIEKTLSTGARSHGNISRTWISLFNLPNVARPDGPFILKISDHQASGLSA